MRDFQSQRTKGFTESVIREMTRRAIQHGAVNLSQGFPDFPAPADVKQKAIEAIEADINQYAVTWGAKPLRDAIAAKMGKHYGVPVNPETEVTVTCGATEGMIATLLAVIDPGDEVIVFEPYYENYLPDAELCGATRRLVSLYSPDWTFKEEELRAAFTPKTKALIINTPNNPTGRVFNRQELELIARLCQEHEVLAINDEIYEHILYDGTEHIPLLTLPGMKDYAISVNAMSKTYSVTGWRVGWVIAPAAVTAGIRKVHDFLTVGAAAPLQAAGAYALSLPDEYYAGLGGEYGGKREILLGYLRQCGFEVTVPQGAYYVMADFRRWGFDDDHQFANWLTTEVGVSCVPGSSFFDNVELGRRYVRFCFCKKDETLHAAGQRLTEAWAKRDQAQSVSA